MTYMPKDIPNFLISKPSRRSNPYSNWKTYQDGEIVLSLNKNVDFWKKKLVINQKRDTKVKSRLKKLGFKVVVVWGHELDSNFEKAMDKMLKKVS